MGRHAKKEMKREGRYVVGFQFRGQEWYMFKNLETKRYSFYIIDRVFRDRKFELVTENKANALVLKNGFRDLDLSGNDVDVEISNLAKLKQAGYYA